MLLGPFEIWNGPPAPDLSWVFFCDIDFQEEEFTSVVLDDAVRSGLA